MAPVLDRQKARSGYDDNWITKYEKHYKELDALLDEDEFQAAVNSTINAHYTDRRVITALWDLARQLGFKGGKVLEPSAGVGHFLGLMPADLEAASTLRAYELDKITGDILSKLYPQATVRVTGYENSVEAPASQDLVISNVPFAAKAPFDAKNPDISNFSLHNYFIAKGIKQLKPGGLGIFITSSSTMDNPGASTKFREWTSTEGNADFIGAIRLPNNAFAENARTEVTTDIMVYRKRTGDQPSDLNQQYRNVVPIAQTINSKDESVPIEVNEYFATHPEMMLGKMALAFQVGKGGLYNPDAQTLQAEGDTALRLGEAIATLPTNIFGATASTAGKTEASTVGEKEGTLITKGGKVFRIENGERVAQKDEKVNGLAGKKFPIAEIVGNYEDLKTAIRELIAAEQGQETTDEIIEGARKKLNTAYTSLTKKVGTLNRNQRTVFLEEDADHVMVASLEDVKKETTLTPDGKVTRTYTIEKAPIFNKRVNFPVKEPTTAENVGDALNISLSYRGKVDVAYLAALTGKTEAAVTDELLTDGLAYENPATGLLEDADNYLSGFVRTKLKEAEGAGEKYASNVEALKKVVPKEIPAALIQFRLGSTWIPPHFIEGFLADQLGVQAQVRYSPEANSWIVQVKDGRDQRNRITYASGDFSASDLVTKTLNLRQPEVTYTIRNADGSKSTVKDAAKTAEAQGKAQELADMFQNYVRDKKEWERPMEEIYNERANNLIEKKQSLPAFKHFPNANPEIILREHQIKAALRALYGSTLLAHQVGTGKTFTMITIAMEMRRLGLARKPMMVVHNATTEQFRQSFKDLYPGAKILAPTKKEMDAKNRQRLFNKIAYGDWDAIIIPQSFLDFIPDDPEREKGYLKQQLDELQEALKESEGDRGTANELRRAMKGIETMLAEVEERDQKTRKVKDIARENLATEKSFLKQASRRRDDVFKFEDMGVDALFLDESHAFKKLGFLTKMERIKGIDTGRSKRALGAFLKTRWIQEKNKNRNVILATGTPITNTMAEVWTMMKFVAPDILDKYGISSFDQFASSFGNVEPSLEFTASGKFKVVERFKSYINAPELLTAFRAKADVVLTEDVPEFKEGNLIPKLKVQPDGKPGYTQVILKQTAGLEQAMAGFKQMLETWEKLSGKEKRALSYLPLLVFNRAKQAAIDLRLLNPKERDDPGSKTNRVVQEVKRIYDETTAYQGTQLVVSDMYQSPDQKDQYLDEEKTIPNPAYGVARFNLFQDMKAKLVKEGVPAEQIAIIHDYEGEKRETLFQRFNEGDIRVLFGTTEKIAVGTNIQQRLKALHHMDAPPRPMDFEQRNGRILRQKNLHAQMDKPVEVLTYGVEKTLDATAYQRLAFKQKFINQMMKAEGVDRVMADEAEEDNATDMTFDQMMSTLSGSQYAVLHTQRMYELRKLKTAKTNHERRIVDMSGQIRTNENMIKALKHTAAEYAPARKEFAKAFPDNKVTTVTIEGKEYKEKLGEEIQKYFDKKLTELNKEANKPSITGSIHLNGQLTSLKFNKHYSLAKGITTNTVDYTIEAANQVGVSADVNTTVSTGQGFVASVNATIKGFVVDGYNGHTNLDTIPDKITQREKDNTALAELIKKPFDKDDKLAKVQAEVADLEEKMKAENAEEAQPKTLEEHVTDISQRSAETFEDLNVAMSSIIPLGTSTKIKKTTSNAALLKHINQQNQAQLEKEIEFRPDVEARFKAAGEPVGPNIKQGFFTHLKDFLQGFKSHFRYLSERRFPREANLLREFEGLKPYAHKQADIYVRGLVEPLTKEQYKILSRRIILEDMLGSIDKGLEMTDLAGKLPFGFEDREEVEKEVKKYVDFTNADPELQKAYDVRNAFMTRFKDELVKSGLLTDNDIDAYYHRRVLAYQDDEFAHSILFGKQIGDKQRDFQRKRRGTRGMDYSTNFIETEYKVVGEGLYELEKQKILKDLMDPYEKELKDLKNQFEAGFSKHLNEVETQFGKGSPEAEVLKAGKQALQRNYLVENLPEGYTVYRVSNDNRLFWAKTVSQSAIDRAMAIAQANDATGTAAAVDAVDYLLGEMSTGLMVGAKRRSYMIPTSLAEELEELGRNETVNPMQGMITRLSGEWKKMVLMAPNRLLKYNLNNFGSDIDRLIQVAPTVTKYTKEAWDELWDFHQTKKVTPQMLEAFRGSVLDSGFEISELNALSKQQWASFFMDKDGPSIDEVFGKKWTAAMIKTVASQPGKLWDNYVEWAAQYTRLRENLLRYAAYKRAVEKVEKGEEFYWASRPESIRAIHDPRQKAAKLARDVFGDYGNISYSGKILRKNLMPFYSWLEINMGTHLQLIKNASSPDAQKRVIVGGLKKGLPAVATKMAMAWARLFLFTAMIEAWNHFLFPLWADDKDKDLAERLRRAHIKGMQVLLYVGQDGKVYTLPVVGAFYDFLDYLGIPYAVDDVAHIFTGTDPWQAGMKAAENEAYNFASKNFLMLTPAIKLPIETTTGQTYFPDPQNPIPIRDYGEYFADALTLKDEYNYFLTDKPHNKTYLQRKLMSSLFMRELDPDMLASHQARHIVEDYTGHRSNVDRPSGNPQERAKFKAESYYVQALRQGQTEEANKYLFEYLSNGGTVQALVSKIIHGGDPLAGLKAKPNVGEAVSEREDLSKATQDTAYKPRTKFVQGLTADEINVFRDAMRYQDRLANQTITKP